MLKETAIKRIERASAQAERAKSVFVNTVRELVLANDTLCAVIEDEKERINEHQLNIRIAGEQIKENDIAINKLKDFLK